MAIRAAKPVQATEPAKHAGGRPSKYTPEIGQSICDAVAEGKTLPTIFSEHAIDARTLYRWRSDEAKVLPDGTQFSQGFAHARVASADVLADRALELLMACPAARDDVAKVRELAQHLRWAAAVRKPQEYSEKREVHVSGGTDNTLSIRWQRPEEAQPVHTIEHEEPAKPAILGPLD